MKNRTELNLGKVFYVWLIYLIQDFWINLLNGYDIYFWLRDTANQPYVKVVTYKSFKTKEKSSWVIPKVVAVTYGNFSLQSLSRSSNEVSQRWS